MKPKSLPEMSLDELKNKEKTLKTAVTVLAVMIFLLFAIGLFLMVKRGFSVFTFLPAVFLPLFTVNLNNLKKTKSEIQSRNA